MVTGQNLRVEEELTRWGRQREQHSNKFCGRFGKWQGAQYWSKGVCVLAGMWRGGLVQNEAVGVGRTLEKGKTWKALHAFGFVL